MKSGRPIIDVFDNVTMTNTILLISAREKVKRKEIVEYIGTTWDHEKYGHKKKLMEEEIIIDDLRKRFRNTKEYSVNWQEILARFKKLLKKNISDKISFLEEQKRFFRDNLQTIDLEFSKSTDNMTLKNQRGLIEEVAKYFEERTDALKSLDKKIESLDEWDDQYLTSLLKEHFIFLREATVVPRKKNIESINQYFEDFSNTLTNDFLVGNLKKFLSKMKKESDEIDFQIDKMITLKIERIKNLFTEYHTLLKTNTAEVPIEFEIFERM